MKRPAQSAEETRRDIELAMLEYERTVLDPTKLDPSTGFYRYSGRVTQEAILLLAGGYRRNTLSAPYHQELKAKIDELLLSLRRKTGKLGRGSAGTETVPAGQLQIDDSARLETMAQTIVALRLRVMTLEAELESRLRPDALLAPKSPHHTRSRRVARRAIER